MGKKVVLLFALLLLFPLISSVPPVFTESLECDDGIVIFVPQQKYIKANTNHTFKFQAFNKSSGVGFTNSSVNCSFMIIDSNGEFTYTLSHAGYDDGVFSVKLTEGNFTEGRYNYGIKCVTIDGKFGGMRPTEYEVTSTGVGIDTSTSILYIGLLAVLIFVFIITIFGINQLPSSNTKDEEGKILSISYLKYLRPVGWFFLWMLFTAILFLSSNMAFAFLGTELFANTLHTLFKICLGLTPVIVIVWMIWIYRQMFHDKQMQKMLNRGFFPDGRLP